MDQPSELLPITKEELESRLKRVRSSLHSTAACALVVSTEANFVYLTDLRFDPLWSSPTRSLILVVRVEGPPTFILPSFVAEEARSKWPDAEIRAYEAPPERVVHRLLETLATCPPGPVAFELEPESRVGISLEDWAVLQASLSREVIDGQRLLWHARLRKSSSELQRLRLASHATSAAFQSLFEQELSGRSERELARSLLASALAAGADRAGWIGITSGSGSYARFVSGPRDRVPELGDMIWADVGVIADGYWSDFCRAGVIGGPTPRQRDLQAQIVEATLAGVAAARPGAPVSEVASSCRKRCEELGLRILGFGRLGHGIGLSATEPPSIAEWDNSILKPGMVITVEPAVVDDSGLYCAEQVIAISESGEPEILSTAPTHLATLS